MRVIPGESLKAQPDSVSQRGLLRSAGVAAGLAATSLAIAQRPAAAVTGAVPWRNFPTDTASGTASELNQLIEDVAAEDGGVVYVEPGTHFIDETILLRTNVTLLGSGAGSVLKKYPVVDNQGGPTFPNVGPMMAMAQLPFDTANNVQPVVSGAVIADLTLDGGISALDANPSYNVGIDVRRWNPSAEQSVPLTAPDDNIRIEIVVARRCFRGFVLADCVRDVKLERCTSILSVTDGFFTDAASDNMLVDCISRDFGKEANNSAAGFLIGGGSNRLRNCKSYFNDGNGFTIEGSRTALAGCGAQDNKGNGFKVDGGTELSNTPQVLISGCMADANRLAGFLVQAYCSGTAITGCVATGRTGSNGEAHEFGLRIDGPTYGVLVSMTCPGIATKVNLTGPPSVDLIVQIPGYP